MNNLKEKRVVVTGGGSGIGLAAAKLFLDQGAKVVIVGRTEEKLRRAAESLKGGDRLLYFPVDVADPKQVQTLMEQVTAKWGAIDILVNNAGMNLKERTLRELTIENWDKMVRANLDGAYYCIHHVLPQMRKRKEGLIININSIAGRRGNPLGGAAYVAAKFGLSGLGMCLAAEEKDNGIRVCNIYPGEVDTPLLEVRPQPVTEEQRRLDLKPEDVASAILFVAGLHPRVSIPELIIKPTAQQFI